MKLYYSQAACSLAPHIALEEAKLPHELEPVNLTTKKYRGGNFYDVNPKGSVPVLQLDDGQLLTEAAVIQQYIADKKPEANLMPKPGTMERYRAQEWLNFIATELHKGWGPLWHKPSPEVAAATKETLDKKLAIAAKRLEKQAYLLGENFSVADGYLFTVLNWAPHTGVDLTKYPPLLGFVERVSQRPAVQAALKAEGLLK
jgi:glutathione S-transferase